MKKGQRLLSNCSECDKPAIARNLCRSHYHKLRYISPRVNTPRVGKCSVDGCTNSIDWSGMCNLHAKRFKAHGDTTANFTLQSQQGPCGAIGCGKPITKGQFCQKHYVQWWRTGSPYRTIAESGTWQLTVNGYMRGTVNGERVYEHIFIAEKALGRKLKNGEEVHHMNEIKSDNHTPFNLVICPSREYHMLLHKRMRDLGINLNYNFDDLEI